MVGARLLPCCFSSITFLACCLFSFLLLLVGRPFFLFSLFLFYSLFGTIVTLFASLLTELCISTDFSAQYEHKALASLRRVCSVTH